MYSVFVHVIINNSCYCVAQIKNEVWSMKKKYKKRCKLLAATVLSVLTANTAFADVGVVPGGPFRTNTTVTPNGANTWDVQTTTTAKGGTVGVNSFKQFDVNNGQTINLNLIHQQQQLLNLVFDSKASQINGIVNSYKNGQIGGNVIFANPNGFVVGEHGVFNVGSLTMMTPTEDSMKKLFSGNYSMNDANVDKLISFRIDDNKYLVHDGIELSASTIEINGTINAEQGGIDLISGSQVDIGSTAQLNANTKLGSLTPDSRTFAMQDGNNITIVASNSGEGNTLDAIVNLNGKVNAGKGDILVKTETFKPNEYGKVKSEINVNNHSELKGNDIDLSAKAKIEDFGSKFSLTPDEETSGFQDFVHGLADVVSVTPVLELGLADIETGVNVNDGSVINATNTTNIEAVSELELSSSAKMETLAINYTNLKLKNEALINSGASVVAKNLNVNATTNLSLETEAQSSSVLERLGDFATWLKNNKNITKEQQTGKLGSFAIAVILEDIVNKAKISSATNLSINDDISVVASTYRSQESSVENGAVPLIDENRGAVGLGVQVINSKLTNEAQMDADATINGKLEVIAGYTGSMNAEASASSSAAGEDNDAGTLGSIYSWVSDYMKAKAGEKLTNVTTRSNGLFDDIHMAGAVNVSVDTISSVAKVGDKEKNIKPAIEAGQITIGSNITDDKGAISAEGEASNGATSAAGAIAVNIKSYDSNAIANGDFTLNGGSNGDFTLNDDSNGNAIIISANTDLFAPRSFLDDGPDFIEKCDSILTSIREFFGAETEQENIKKEWDKTVDNNNVGDYIKSLGVSDELNEVSNAGGSFDIFEDLGDLGVSGFFGTWATAESDAQQKTGDTKSISGAVAASAYNVNTVSSLSDGSTVTVKSDTNNNVLINSRTNDEIQTGASLFGLGFNSEARDGDAYGVGIAVNYADISTKANIEDNSKVQYAGSSAGDINVNAKENGRFVNVAAGSANGDSSGMSGSIGFTYLQNGTTEAYIGNNTTISANKVSVTADKNDVFISPVASITKGDSSKGMGISGILLDDTVDAHIGGNVSATGDITVDAKYDKKIINVNANVGVASNGGKEEEEEEEQPNIWEEKPWYKKLANFIEEKASSAYHAIPIVEAMDLVKTARDCAEYAQDGDADLGKTLDPNRKTSQYTGGVTFNLAGNSVKSYIADNATIVSNGGNVKLNATSKDTIVDAGAVLSINGQKGGGALLSFTGRENDIETSIGKNANVTALNNIDLTAKEDGTLVGVGAGVSVKKEKSGEGTISIELQKNTVEALVKDGAKLTTNTANEDINNAVNVEAIVDSAVVKVAGSVSASTGGSATDGAVGTTVDADVTLNTITANVTRAEINTSNLKVDANNKDKFLAVDVAGAGAAQGTAGAGVLGAYVAVNDIEASVKNSKINQAKPSGANVNINGESIFREIDIAGTVAAGNQTGVGATLRTDVVSNKIDTFIDNSTLNTNNTILTNKDSIDQISIAVAGAGSTSSNAGAGVGSVLIDLSEQNNYINNSTITTNSLTLDSDKIFNTLAVTGAVAVGLGSDKPTVGLSAYTNILDHTVYTYIKNSNITSQNDISLASDFNQDTLSIVFGGSLGNDALSGAVDVLVNNSTSKTYILSEDDSQIKSENGKISVHSTNDINTKNIDGHLAAGGAAAGVSINATVYDSTIESGINGGTISAKNGLDIASEATQNHLNVVAGVALGGGEKGTVDGSISTLVMKQNMHSYLQNAKVLTDGDILVKASDTLELDTAIGTASASGTNAGAGAILTLVTNGDVTASVENVDVDKKSDKLKKLKVEAYQKDTIKGGTGSGAGGATNGIAGAIDTIVMNKTITAKVDDLKNINSSSFSEVEINATGNTDYTHGTGAASVGGTNGVGGTIATLVLNKDVYAEILNSGINSVNNISNSSNSTTDIVSFILGFGGAGTVAANGSVGTQVFDVNTYSIIDNSTVSSTAGKIDNISYNDFDLDMYLANANGAGTAAVGGVVYTLVNNSTANASIQNGSTINPTGVLNNKSTMDSNYELRMVNASGAGTAAVNGTVDTVVLNEKSISKIDNTKIVAKDEVNVEATNDSDVSVIMLQASGAGTAAANGGVNTVVSTKETVAQISSTNSEKNKTDINAVKNIIVNANSTEDIGTTVVGGAGAGTAAITGAVNTMVSDNTTTATINNSDVKTTVEAGENNGINILANDNYTLTGRTGVAGGAGVAAVGGSVVTGVIGNKTTASIANNSDVKAINSNINISASATETIGSSDNPFITLAANGAGAAAVQGITDVLVLNSDIYAQANDSTISAAGNIDTNADSQTDLFLTTGAGGGAGAASIGATVNVVTIDKTIDATSNKSTITAENFNSTASADDTFTTVTVAGNGAGVAAVNGLVNVNSITSRVNAGATNSKVYADNIKIEANANPEIDQITGQASGAGVAGVGATVVVNNLNYNFDSKFLNNIARAKNGTDKIEKIDVDASVINNFNITEISASAGGVAGASGIVNINNTNNIVKAGVTGDIKAKNIDVDAKDITNYTATTGVGGGGGFAGIGIGLQKNSITSTVSAYAGGSNLVADNIDVDASAEQNFKDLKLIGAAVSGSFSGSGSVLLNSADATVKSYITDNSKITANAVNVTAENKTNIDEIVGAASASLGGAVGASVAINNVSNTVEAFTGKNVTINAQNDINLTAKSNATIGKDSSQKVVAGSAGLVAGIAGAVIYNDVETNTKAFLGSDNTINTQGDLNINANNNTSIRGTAGSLGAGLVGVGASVYINKVRNSVLSSIGKDAEVEANNVTVNAENKENYDLESAVVAGGGLALAGGVTTLSTGEFLDLASKLSGEDKKVYASSINQTNDILNDINSKQTEENKFYIAQYNDASDKIDKKISEANNNANKFLEQGLNSTIDSRNTTNKHIDSPQMVIENTNTTINPKGIEKKDSNYSLFAKNSDAVSGYSGTDLTGSTSAMIDTGANVTATNNLNVTAKDTSVEKLTTNGAVAGAAAIGVSIASSTNKAITNAYVSSDVNIKANKIDINATQTDSNTVITNAASGGIIGGSGSKADATTQKFANTCILSDSVLKVINNIDVTANSTNNVQATANAGSFGGFAVGVSEANAISGGNTNITFGGGVNMQADNGYINIANETINNATSTSYAATGSLIGANGTIANANIIESNQITTGEDFKAKSKGKLAINSSAENRVNSTSNARAYGGISAGGSESNADIASTSGINIANTDNSDIEAGEIEIYSSVTNFADSHTEAGAGAIIGKSGSSANTNINANNEAFIGSGYNVTTTDGIYEVNATSNNNYKSYNNSSAYGVAGIATGSITNRAVSNVTATSNANVESAKSINVLANNSIIKNLSGNYDMVGGAGGLAGIGSAAIYDDANATTKVNFGGEYAKTHGGVNDGKIVASGYTDLTINEKADVTTGGAIASSGSIVSVTTTSNTSTNISNQNIKTDVADIDYEAINDVYVYSKSNVDVSGLAATPSGASAIYNNEYSSVNFKNIDGNGVNSLSTRDTNIQSQNYKDINAYMYSDSHGAVWQLGDGYAQANNNSWATINLDKDAKVRSGEFLNITASDNSYTVSPHRYASATGYIVFGIPITKNGDGENQFKVNNYGNQIKMGDNSLFESGVYSDKHITINNDGTYEAEGIEVKGLEKIGTLTSDDLNLALQNLKDNYAKLEQETEEAYTYIEGKKSEQGNIATEAQSAINNATEQQQLLENSLQTSIDAISTIDTDLADMIEEIGNDENRYSEVDNYISTTYGSDETTKATINTNWSTIKSCNSELVSVAETIEINNNAITAANSKIEEWNNYKIKLGEKLQTAHVALTEKEQEYQAQLEEQGGTVDVYSLALGDAIIRGGRTNISGHVTGTGTIKAPGDGFSIDIINNSANAMSYGKLIIEKDARGGIGVNGSIANTITQDIGAADGFTINVKNMLDINDPTINMESMKNIGNMVFNDTLENVKGSINLVNYTGDIITEGTVTAQKLNIISPNGNYNQLYQNNNYSIGNGSAILAGQDLNIEARRIDINGLIQSGSAIKSVDIPDFTVEYDAENNKYYQVMGETRIEMIKSETAQGNCYYINLDGSDEINSDLQLIKAYFKPTNVGSNDGEILLFKSNINGGNITLTGNIISSTGNGEIRLVNGYGHINVANNSHYTLDTSNLNADNQINGKLTINDFYLNEGGEQGNSGSTFNIKTHEDLFNENNEIKADFRNYITTNVAEIQNGTISTASSGYKDSGATVYNGSFSEEVTKTTASDGLTTYSTEYKLGQDALLTNEDVSVSELSPLYKLLKKYYATFGIDLNESDLFKEDVTKTTEYTSANNPIKVSFSGYDSPEINITSAGNINIQGSISAMDGNINILSTDGNITGLGTVSGTNINLNAHNTNQDATIGTVDDVLDYMNSTVPINVQIHNDGKLTANSEKLVAVNFANSDTKSVEINTATGGKAYIGASNDISNINNSINITANADELHLVSMDGAINFQDNGSVTNDDGIAKLVYLYSNGDINYSAIGDILLERVDSEANGNINISATGNIDAVSTDSQLYKNIYGKNITLSSGGHVGSEDTPITIGYKSILNVDASDDVYVSSPEIMFIEHIDSTNGSVNVHSDSGIMATGLNAQNIVEQNPTIAEENVLREIENDDFASTIISAPTQITLEEYNPDTIAKEVSIDDLAPYEYNIKAKGDVNLSTTTGNIENIVIDTDGTINASAGYTDGQISGIGSVQIIAKPAEKIDETKAAQMTEQEILDYQSKSKDMTIGKIQATDNISLSSEKSILNADNNSVIKGNDIILNAVGGNIGKADSPMNIDTVLDNGRSYHVFSAYAGDDKDIYINSRTGLSIDEIKAYSTKDNSSDGSVLNKVVISVDTGDITNKNNTVVLKKYDEQGRLVDKDGNLIDEDGNIIDENGNIIQRADDKKNKPNIIANEVELNVKTGDIGRYNADFNITAYDKLSYDADNVYIKTIESDLNIDKAKADANSRINANNQNVSVNNANTTYDFDIIDAKNAEVNETIVGNNFNINASGNVELNNAQIGKNADIIAGNNIKVENNLNVDGNAILKAENDIEIKFADVKGNVEFDSDNLSADKLSVGGNADIIADKNIILEATTINRNMKTESINLKANELSLDGILTSNADTVDISSAKDLNVDTIQGKTNNYADNVSIKSEKSILNAAQKSDTSNVYGNKINLASKNNIGDKNKSFLLNMTPKHTINIQSDNDVYSTINAENDTNINNLKFKNGKILAHTQNIDINNMEIGGNADIYTNNKYVAVRDNFKPVQDADVQLYMTKSPSYLNMTPGDDIKTDMVNVVRHTPRLIINGQHSGGMKDTIVEGSEAQVRNFNQSYKSIEKKAMDMPTVDAYVNDVIKNIRVDGDIIKGQDGSALSGDISTIVNTNTAAKKEKRVYFWSNKFKKFISQEFGRKNRYKIKSISYKKP